MPKPRADETLATDAARIAKLDAFCNEIARDAAKHARKTKKTVITAEMEAFTRECENHLRHDPAWKGR